MRLGLVWAVGGLVPGLAAGLAAEYAICARTATAAQELEERPADDDGTTGHTPEPPAS